MWGKFKRVESGSKPVFGSDMMCPFFRKPLREVCHRCEFYEALPMDRIDITNMQSVGGFDHWGCTLKHQTLVQRDTIKTLKAVQQATESFRNTAYEDQQKNMEALISVLGRAERTISAIPRDVTPQLLNGKKGG